MVALKNMKDRGITIIFITHKQNILTLADKLILIKDGKIVMYDTRDKVLEFLSQNKVPVIAKKQ